MQKKWVYEYVIYRHFQSQTDIILVLLKSCRGIRCRGGTLFGVTQKRRAMLRVVGFALFSPSISGWRRAPELQSRPTSLDPFFFRCAHPIYYLRTFSFSPSPSLNVAQTRGGMVKQAHLSPSTLLLDVTR